MTIIIKIVTASLLIIIYSSCNFAFDGIQGEGEVTKMKKTISQDFKEVKSSRGIRVVLENKDDGTVTVEANENLHDHINVYVEGEVLHITADKNIYQADKKNVYIPYKNVQKLSATSGSEITSQETIEKKDLTLSTTSGANIDLIIKAKNLETSLTSGSNMRLSGRVQQHEAKATSGANLNALDLSSLITEAKGTSGAIIRIHAKDEFTGKATSGANVEFYGNPKNVSKDDNSGGIVKKH